jgi:hypothetical protein
VALFFQKPGVCPWKSLSTDDADGRAEIPGDAELGAVFRIAPETESRTEQCDGVSRSSSLSHAKRTFARGLSLLELALLIVILFRPKIADTRLMVVSSSGQTVSVAGCKGSLANGHITGKDAIYAGLT